MKTLIFALLAAMPVAASAEALLITAKVLDRADNGSAIRELFVYPSAVLESGETGSIHIGPVVQVPVGTRTVDLGEGVSKEETVYEEVPIGLDFTLTYTLDNGIIDYTARAVVAVSGGTSGQVSYASSSEIVFYGQTELGGLVEAQLVGPYGTEEEIAFHFGPAPDEE